MRLQKIGICAVFIVIAGSISPAGASIWAPGARKVEEPLASLLAQIRKEKIGVFFSECALADEMKAVMIFHPGSQEGYLFSLAYRPNRNVVNVPSRGRVIIKGDGISVVRVEGLTKELVPGLGNTLAGRNFIMLWPGDDPINIVTSRPERTCTGQPNARP